MANIRRSRKCGVRDPGARHLLCRRNCFQGWIGSNKVARQRVNIDRRPSNNRRHRRRTARPAGNFGGILLASGSRRRGGLFEKDRSQPGLKAFLSRREVGSNPAAQRAQQPTEVLEKPLHLRKGQVRCWGKPTRPWGPPMGSATGPRPRETGLEWGTSAAQQFPEIVARSACRRKNSPTKSPYPHADERRQRHPRTPKLADRNPPGHGRY